MSTTVNSSDGFLHRCKRCSCVERIQGEGQILFQFDRDSTQANGIGVYCKYCAKAIKKTKIWVLLDEKLGNGAPLRYQLSRIQEGLIRDKILEGDRVFIGTDGESLFEWLLNGRISEFRYSWDLFLNSYSEWELLPWKNAEILDWTTIPSTKGGKSYEHCEECSTSTRLIYHFGGEECPRKKPTKTYWQQLIEGLYGGWEMGEDSEDAMD